jgi:hypothetical protein
MARRNTEALQMELGPDRPGLALHRGFDGRGRGARRASGGDDFCLALHEAVEGRRHCVDVFHRHDDGAVAVGVD